MKNQWKTMMALMLCAGVANAAYVTIGGAGNAADTSGYGAVDYTYKISATEVSIAECNSALRKRGVKPNCIRLCLVGTTEDIRRIERFNLWKKFPSLGN